MILILKRFISFEKGTPGILLGYDDVPFCLTLEPVVPIIPEGIYDLKKTVSTRLKKLLPEILNVPGHSGVRIHSGNSISDTQGCILVGDRYVRDLTTFFGIAGGSIILPKLMIYLKDGGKIKIS